MPTRAGTLITPAEYHTRYQTCAFYFRGRVLDALMQQKSSGAIPGICGRLVSSVAILVSFLTHLLLGRPWHYPGQV